MIEKRSIILYSIKISNQIHQLSILYFNDQLWRGGIVGNNINSESQGSRFNPINTSSADKPWYGEASLSSDVIISIIKKNHSITIVKSLKMPHLFNSDIQFG